MILNRQRRVRVPLQKLAEFSARALRVLRLSGDALAICLVTEAQIERWNHSYRGKKAPTDVLSFRSGDSAGDSGNGNRRKSKAGAGDPYLGDIAIAPSVARRNARRFGRSFEEEMRILILHGILHLMGYDHETDNGQMERRERRLRRALGLT